LFWHCPVHLCLMKVQANKVLARRCSQLRHEPPPPGKHPKDPAVRCKRTGSAPEQLEEQFRNKRQASSLRSDSADQTSKQQDSCEADPSWTAPDSPPKDPEFSFLTHEDCQRLKELLEPPYLPKQNISNEKLASAGFKSWTHFIWCRHAMYI